MGAPVSPRPASGAFVALVALTALTGCTREVMTRVELAAIQTDHAFFVFLDAAGTPVRVTPVFAARAGGGPTPSFALEAREERLVLVALDDAALEAHHPAYDRARPEALEATLEVPPEKWVARPLDGVRLAKALPEGARLYGARLLEGEGGLAPASDEARDAVLAAVTLAIPVDHAVCLEPGVGRLVSFGRTRSVTSGLPDQTKDARAIQRARWVDADRAVAVTTRYALFVERGRDLVLDPVAPGRRGGYFDPLAFEPGMAAGIADMVLDRSRPGPVVVVAVGSISMTEDRAEGRVWELAVHDDGLELVRTTTLTFGPESVAIDPQGAIALVEYGLFAETRAPGATAFERLPRLEPAPDRGAATHRVLWTGDAREPLVATTADRLHVYDAALGAWKTTDVTFSALSPGTPLDPTRDKLLFRGLAVRPLAEGVEVWAGGDFGGLFRRPSFGEWTRVDYLAPPGYSNCSRPVGNYPDVLMSSPIDDLVFDGGYLYAAFRECAAVIGLRVEDLCAETLGLEGLEPAPSDIADLQALDLLNGRLMVAGESGQLYVE